MDTRTLNERGRCDCGNKTFTLLEHIYISLVLTDEGVLEQYGTAQQSEIINVACNRCGLVWDVGELGDIKLRALA
jgi:hypothetical protein